MMREVGLWGEKSRFAAFLTVVYKTSSLSKCHSLLHSLKRTIYRTDMRLDLARQATQNKNGVILQYGSNASTAEYQPAVSTIIKVSYVSRCLSTYPYSTFC